MNLPADMERNKSRAMDGRISVVQLIPGLIVGDLGGGLELYSIRLAQALDRRLFRVQMVCLWRFDRPVEQQWEAELRHDGIEVHYGPPYNPRMTHAVVQSLTDLRALIKRLRPDIIHAHGEYAGVIGMGLRLTNRSIPLIRTCHTTCEFPNHPPLRLATAMLYPFLATVQVGVSSVIVDNLRRHPLVRITRQPIWAINNGIDIERIIQQRRGTNIRQELGLHPNIPLFGLVGRLTEQKGIPDALRAFALVREHLPHAVLIIVGDGYGEKPQRLKEQAAALGLSQAVFWLGARPDAIDIIASLDVLLSASLWEGLPTVILEAMAVGTPVVATDIPGTRELVLHEQTGLLAPPQNPPALAQAMIRVISNPGLAQLLATSARERAAQFSITAAARQYERLYRSLIPQNKPITQKY